MKFKLPYCLLSPISVRFTIVCGYSSLLIYGKIPFWYIPTDSSTYIYIYIYIGGKIKTQQGLLSLSKYLPCKVQTVNILPYLRNYSLLWVGQLFYYGFCRFFDKLILINHRMTISTGIGIPLMDYGMLNYLFHNTQNHHTISQIRPSTSSQKFIKQSTNLQNFIMAVY